MIYFMIIFELIKKCIINNTDLSNRMSSGIIIGSGFLAKNFKQHENLFKKLNIHVYAAGVANSLCKNKDLFEIDKNRLVDFSKQMDKKNKILYFSTCSIGDPSRNNNEYIKNKLILENYIKSNFEKYLIIRLPEVVGHTKNDNTLIKFFYNKIKNKQTFNLWSKASRSVIDIDDVTKILIDLLSRKKLDKSVINIANPLKYSPIQIVNIFEQLISTKARYNLIDQGKLNWRIDVSQILDSIKNCKIDFNNSYLKNVLKKYFT